MAWTMCQGHSLPAWQLPRAPAAGRDPGLQSGHVCPTLPTRAGNGPGTGRGEASPGAPSNPRRGEVRGRLFPSHCPLQPPGPPLPPCEPRYTLLPAATGRPVLRARAGGARRDRQLRRAPQLYRQRLLAITATFVVVISSDVPVPGHDGDGDGGGGLARPPAVTLARPA